MNCSKHILKLAGILTLLIAIVQAVLTCLPSWSTQYFEFWKSVAESRPFLFYSAGAAATLIFTLFALYALSGAGLIRRMPLLKAGLIIISSLFIFRGLTLIPVLLINNGSMNSPRMIPVRELYFAGISLLIGIMYLTGTIGYWSKLPANSRKEDKNQ